MVPVMYTFQEPDNDYAITALQICSFWLGNNQPVPETGSTLKTSTIILCYNQPVPETNKQYWQYCNPGIFRKCDIIVSTIIAYTSYVSMLFRKEQKVRK